MEESIYPNKENNQNQVNINENNNVSPKQRPILTYILIAINILVWLLINAVSLFSADSYDSLLVTYGAKINALILQGEFWRFITPIFLHAGLLHLGANSYSLFYLGTQTELFFGPKRFTVIYLFSGLMGSIASFAFSASPSVGASGAIFGLMGAMLYIIYRRPALLQTSLGINLVTIIGINLALGFTNVGIDNYAHIGGLIGGFLITGTFYNANQNKTKKIWLSGTRALFVAIFIALGVLIYGFYAPMNRVFTMLDDLTNYNVEENWVDAEKTAEDILKINSINDGVKAETLWGLSIAEAMQEKWEESIEHAEQLVDTHPSTGHYLLGILYYDMGEYSSAREELLLSKMAGPEYADWVDSLISEIDGMRKH